MSSKKQEAFIKFDLREVLTLFDLYTLAMLVIYTILAFALFPKLADPATLILTNFFIAFAAIAIATVEKKTNSGVIFLAIRRLYVLPVLFIIYSQVQYYIRAVNPYLYDDFLITIDRAILGFDPTVILHKISFPVLTEYLQFAYMTYFIMPIIQAFELHFRNNDEKFNHFLSMILFAFYVSYLLYFFLPAVGPRFALHNFSLLSNEMPGILLADFFRDIINTGGGIVKGALNPDLLVNRDCMPSGHTMMTITNIFLGFKNRSKFRWVFLAVGSSLIFSTVYLRYHYVVDLIAGAICAILIINVEPKVRVALKKRGFINA